MDITGQTVFALAGVAIVFLSMGVMVEWRSHRKVCPCRNCARWRERVMAEAKKKIGAE